MDYYEKLYKEALNRAKKIYKTVQDYLCKDSQIGVECIKNTLTDVFPELAESEGERIRKELIEHCKNQAKPYIYTGNKCPQIQSWISWLEKQGEKLPVGFYFVNSDGKKFYLDTFKYGDVILHVEKQGDQEDEEKDDFTIYYPLKNGKGEYECIPYSFYGTLTSFSENSDLINFLRNCFYTEEECEEWIEKQGEQETLCDKCRKEQPSHSCQDITALGRCAVEHEQKPTDMIERQFRVGDWIVNNLSKDTFLIKSVNSEYCTLEDIKGNIISPCLPPCESESHLWIIQDAKPGDVLATDDWVFIFKKINSNGKPVCYCHYDIELGFHIDTNSYISTGSEIYPATKEQRDTLMKAMADAGWTFDFEKKKLKEIEFNPDDLIEESYQQQADDLIDMVTDKPTWSEEDEERFRSCLCILLSKGLMGDTETINTKWLKSIKERLKGK